MKVQAFLMVNVCSANAVVSASTAPMMAWVHEDKSNRGNQ